MLAKNQLILKTEPCPLCGRMDEDSGAEWFADPTKGWIQVAKKGMTMCPKPSAHRPIRSPKHFNYFKIGGDWFVIKQMYVEALLSLIEVEDVMTIYGAMEEPSPTRITTQTSLIALLKKKNIPDEEIDKFFDVSRMRGRVLNKLIKG